MVTLQLDSNTANNGAAATINIAPDELMADDDDDAPVGESTSVVSGSGAASSTRLARSLVSVGFLTLLMDTAVALHKPRGGVIFGRHVLAYYLTLAGIFAAGLAELWAAFSLSRSAPADAGRRVAFARAVLYASVVPLVLVIDLGGFSVLIKI